MRMVDGDKSSIMEGAEGGGMALEMADWAGTPSTVRGTLSTKKFLLCRHVLHIRVGLKSSFGGHFLTKNTAQFHLHG